MAIELKEDVFYSFGDMMVKATTDFDYNPIIEISTDEGNVIVMPSSNHTVILKTTVDQLQLRNNEL